MSTIPLIAHVKRHSLEDGPGIRSVVFFKGCPLRCTFCHNPECQETAPELVFSPRDCLGCGACEQACPCEAIQIDESRRPRIQRTRCAVRESCDACMIACPTSSLRTVGQAISIDDLVAMLLRDRRFYQNSGGGVTLSGGEATMFPEYLEVLIRQLKTHGVDVRLQTAGWFEWSTFDRYLLQHLDGVEYDLKVMAIAEHKAATGVDNTRILDNCARLSAAFGSRLFPRMPIVPGINDSESNLAALVDFLVEINAHSLSLLPYNPLGLQGLDALGHPRPRVLERFMTAHEENRIRDRLNDILRRKRISMPTV